MREIKYRAWYLDQELMCDVDGFDFPNKQMTVYHHGFYNGQETCGIDDLPIMQYIGIKDTEEKEIYEGDIVEDNYGRRNIVRFLNGLFLIGNWNVHGFINAFQEFKVVGNIYQTPELIKEETKCSD